MNADFPFWRWGQHESYNNSQIFLAKNPPWWIYDLIRFQSVALDTKQPHRASTASVIHNTIVGVRCISLYAVANANGMDGQKKSLWCFHNSDFKLWLQRHIEISGSTFCCLVSVFSCPTLLLFFSHVYTKNSWVTCWWIRCVCYPGFLHKSWLQSFLNWIRFLLLKKFFLMVKDKPFSCKFMFHLELQVFEPKLNCRTHLSDFLLELQNFVSAISDICRQFGYGGITSGITKI